MCGGGGGDQTVTQKTELDPAMRRLLYGGTLANPRGGFGSDVAAAAAAANPVTTPSMGGGGGGGADGGPDGFGGGYGGEPSFGDIGSVSGTGGLYAMGGMVAPQQGLASLNQGQMPMMGGQMPNLSDPMTAATLAMAVRQPELQYGQIMASPAAGFAMGGYVEGPGTGRSDDIEAQIYQNGVPVQEARLSDGEFVMTENAVRGAGNGDREEGAAKMYRMMQEFERGGRV